MRFFVWHMPLTTWVPACTWQWIIAYRYQSTKPPHPFLPFPPWSRQSSGLVVRNTWEEFHSCQWTSLPFPHLCAMQVRRNMGLHSRRTWTCILIQDSQNRWSATIFKKWVGNSSRRFFNVSGFKSPLRPPFFFLDTPLSSTLRSAILLVLSSFDVESWTFEQKSVLLLSWWS